MEKILFTLLPYKFQQSVAIKESSGIEFECPSNCVMTGRMHNGDENGKTTYEYASLIPDYYYVGAKDPVQSGSYKESNSQFICPDGTIMIGRQHSGDENGNTYYWYSALYFRSFAVQVKNSTWSAEIKESDSYFMAPDGCVITGRKHTGDENGKTSYQYSELYVGDKKLTITDIQQSGEIKESSNTLFMGPNNSVIVGRKHSGDENGKTWYYYGFIYFDITDTEVEGQFVTTCDQKQSSKMKESNSVYVAPENTVLTGRQHSGDENGDTDYLYSKINLGGWVATRGAITCSGQIKESSGTWYRAPFGYILVGRSHSGDENGNTTYSIAQMSLNQTDDFYRKPTTTEWNSLHKAFPLLLKENVWVTGESTPKYNCIAWSLNFKDRWINPAGTLAAFKSQYATVGYNDIDPYSNQVFVNGWAQSYVPTHGSKLYTGPAVGVNTLWESKLGQEIRITHGQDELKDSSYGQIMLYCEAPFSLKNTTKKSVDMQIVKSQQLSSDKQKILETKKNKISLQTKQNFEIAFRNWKNSWFKEELMYNSNTWDRAKGILFEKLRKMGIEILPLVIEKLLQTDNFVALVLYDTLQDSDYVIRYTKDDEDIYEGEQARAKRTVALWFDLCK